MEITQAPPTLHAAGGGPCPPGLAEDLRRLSRLPAAAIAAFWQALGPCLRAAGSPDTERILDIFCAAYHLDAEELAGALKACRFLIDGAARLDLPADRLALDLDLLCPDSPETKMLLLAGYEPIKEEIRRDILACTLADHGKTLIGAQWRVDVLDSSDRGARLRAAVVMLTLHYREGGEVRRITLQALPDMMGQLKQICDQVLR